MASECDAPLAKWEGAGRRQIFGGILRRVGNGKERRMGPSRGEGEMCLASKKIEGKSMEARRIGPNLRKGKREVWKANNGIGIGIH